MKSFHILHSVQRSDFHGLSIIIFGGKEQSTSEGSIALLTICCQFPTAWLVLISSLFLRLRTTRFSCQIWSVRTTAGSGVLLSLPPGTSSGLCCRNAKSVSVEILQTYEIFIVFVHKFVNNPCIYDTHVNDSNAQRPISFFYL